MKRKPKLPPVDPDEYVEVTYDVLESKMSLIQRICNKFNVEWREEGQIESRPGRVEWTGVICGKYKDVLKFFRGSCGKEAEQYIADYRVEDQDDQFQGQD